MGLQKTVNPCESAHTHGYLTNRKGITLITLIITILVMLILATVTINFVVREDGLITKAQNAIKKHEQKEILESLQTCAEYGIGEWKWIDKPKKGYKVEIGEIDVLETYNSIKKLINSDNLQEISKDYHTEIDPRYPDTATFTEEQLDYLLDWALSENPTMEFYYVKELKEVEIAITGKHGIYSYTITTDRYSIKF